MCVRHVCYACGVCICGMHVCYASVLGMCVMHVGYACVLRMCVMHLCHLREGDACEGLLVLEGSYTDLEGPLLHRTHLHV